MDFTKSYIDFFETGGISGWEDDVRELFKKEFKNLNIEYITDNLGSIFAVKKSKVKNAPKVMVAAHMDEVSFVVSKINKSGTLKIKMMGGIWTNVIMGQRVNLKLRTTGKNYQGAIIATSAHLLTAEQKTKAVAIEKMNADFGFLSKEDAIKSGVRKGDQITFNAPFVKMGEKRILSKAIDDRLGCIMVLQALKEVINDDLPFDLYIGATVQEEVGIRGAKTAVSMIKPDFAIITDISASLDDVEKEGYGSLGEGTVLRVQDRGTVTLPRILNYQEKLAVENNIKTQDYFSFGGTDASVVHLNDSGVPTMQCGMLARSLHTSCSVADIDDIDATIKMIIAVLRDIDKEKIEKLNKF